MISGYENRKLSEIELYKFEAKVAKERYEIELKRTESILAQSNRIMVFLSLLSTAVASILPTLLDNFNSQKDLIWKYYITFSILIIFNLLLLTLSQWRYKYLVMPSAQQIVDASKNTEIHSFDLYYFQIDFYEKMKNDIKKNNNKRCMFVKISAYFLILIFVCLICLILSILMEEIK